MLKIGALTRAWSARKTGGARGPSPRRAASKSKKIGVRHGVLGACVFEVINAGNVEIAALEHANHDAGGTCVKPGAEKNCVLL